MSSKRLKTRDDEEPDDDDEDDEDKKNKAVAERLEHKKRDRK